VRAVYVSPESFATVEADAMKTYVLWLLFLFLLFICLFCLCFTFSGFLLSLVGLFLFLGFGFIVRFLLGVRTVSSSASI
jgi:hypothetical protein